MKKILFVLIWVISATVWAQEKAPFTLSVVPGSTNLKYESSIEITRRAYYFGEVPSVREFYLVLTNVSNKPQTIFEFGNSWGTDCISLEITTSDGKKYIAKYRGIFTKNYPSVFLLPPGEHYVYPMRLDGWWAPKPEMPQFDVMPVTLKAIYNIEPPTPGEASGADESDKAVRSVWVGRVESKEYKFTLREREETKPARCKSMR